MDDKMNRNSTEETEKNINASSEQSNLDSLLLDNEDDFIKETPENGKSFESFMSEYRTMMSKNLAGLSADEEKSAEEQESEFLISKPKSKSQRRGTGKRSSQKPKKNSDWDEGITLAPESYVDPGEEDKIRIDEIPEEEEIHVPDFNLGESNDTDAEKVQISINFNGEEKSEPADEEEKENVYNPEKPRLLDWVFDFAEMFIFVLLAVMIITSFFFKHSVVEGDSMLNTLHDGEHLIITDVFYTPERGDIIVFEDYSTQLKKAVVKRVIGLPGDTVEVKLNEAKEYEVYVNGIYLEEEYAYNDVEPNAYGLGTWTVGEGEIFVMGDNRYNSTDSRSSLVGPVEIDSILGKVILRFYPFDKFGAVE